MRGCVCVGQTEWFGFFTCIYKRFCRHRFGIEGPYPTPRLKLRVTHLRLVGCCGDMDVSQAYANEANCTEKHSSPLSNPPPYVANRAPSFARVPLSCRIGKECEAMQRALR